MLTWCKIYFWNQFLTTGSARIREVGAVKALKNNAMVYLQIKQCFKLINLRVRPNPNFFNIWLKNLVLSLILKLLIWDSILNASLVPKLNNIPPKKIDPSKSEKKLIFFTGRFPLPYYKPVLRTVKYVYLTNLLQWEVFNRPGVAGAVLQTPL